MLTRFARRSGSVAPSAARHLLGTRRAASSFLTEYQQHVDERAAQGIVPLPLDAQRTAALVELLAAPPADEADVLTKLLVDRVPPGVDEAAYVKAGFLAAIVKGKATAPTITAERAVELLGTMQVYRGLATSPAHLPTSSPPRLPTTPTTPTTPSLSGGLSLSTCWCGSGPLQWSRHRGHASP